MNAFQVNILKIPVEDFLAMIQTNAWIILLMSHGILWYHHGVYENVVISLVALWNPCFITYKTASIALMIFQILNYLLIYCRKHENNRPVYMAITKRSMFSADSWFNGFTKHWMITCSNGNDYHIFHAKGGVKSLEETYSIVNDKRLERICSGIYRVGMTNDRTIQQLIRRIQCSKNRVYTLIECQQYAFMACIFLCKPRGYLLPITHFYGGFIVFSMIASAGILSYLKYFKVGYWTPYIFIDAKWIIVAIIFSFQRIRYPPRESLTYTHIRNSIIILIIYFFLHFAMKPYHFDGEFVVALLITTFLNLLLLYLIVPPFEDSKPKKEEIKEKRRFLTMAEMDEISRRMSEEKLKDENDNN